MSDILRRKNTIDRIPNKVFLKISKILLQDFFDLFGVTCNKRPTWLSVVDWMGSDEKSHVKLEPHAKFLIDATIYILQSFTSDAGKQREFPNGVISPSKNMNELALSVSTIVKKFSGLFVNGFFNGKKPMAIHIVGSVNVGKTTAIREYANLKIIQKGNESKLFIGRIVEEPVKGFNQSLSVKISFGDYTRFFKRFITAKSDGRNLFETSKCLSLRKIPNAIAFNTSSIQNGQVVSLDKLTLTHEITLQLEGQVACIAKLGHANNGQYIFFKNMLKSLCDPPMNKVLVEHISGQYMNYLLQFAVLKSYCDDYYKQRQGIVCQRGLWDIPVFLNLMDHLAPTEFMRFLHNTYFQIIDHFNVFIIHLKPPFEKTMNRKFTHFERVVFEMKKIYDAYALRYKETRLTATQFYEWLSCNNMPVMELSKYDSKKIIKIIKLMNLMHLTHGLLTEGGG